MTMQESQWIWQNGNLRPWQDATTHVLTHALHYGSSVFEGIRAYETPDGPTFFRLRAHIERLFDSAKIHAMPMPFAVDELMRACERTVAKNELPSAYVRPLAFRGYGSLGVDASACPVEVIVATLPWGRYLGADAIDNGIDVCISSWQRCAPNTLPMLAKAGGNYLSSQLIHAEARRNGYHEGIALASDGTISEGAGENVFMVHNGILHTPGSDQSILDGITRQSVITLARSLGLEVVQSRIPRERLCLADEAFLTGTAAEITPVRSVDRIPIGTGARGPITESLQRAFFGLFTGDTEDQWQWLSPVGVAP